MKKVYLIVVCILVLSIALTACGGSKAPAAGNQAPAATKKAPAAGNQVPAATEAPAGATEASAGTEAPAAATEAPATGGTEVKNSTSFDWCEIYVSPASEDNWGDNQLADGVQIAVGESFMLQNLSAGMYDVKLTGCDGASEGTIQIEVK